MSDMNDINQMMKKMAEMQKTLEESQVKIQQMLVSGDAGAGLVKIVMDGRHFAKSCSIDESVFKEGKETLEDLVVAAINAAANQIEARSRQLMLTEIERLTKDGKA